MFRFRLRTLLIAVAVLAVPCAWVGYQLNWIRQRHAEGSLWPKGIPRWATQTPYPRGPGFLWMFGEYGRYQVFCRRGDFERISRLFPEAHVSEVEHFEGDD